jgi:hypothetical protein
MRLVGLTREVPDNMCLFKIQMDKRNSQGLGNDKSNCYRCNGMNKYCDDYTPLKSQVELVESLADNLGENWK